MLIRRSLRLAAALACLLTLPAPAARAAHFELAQDDKGVTVKVDGQFFTRYVIKSGAKPILWPLVGPTGKEMTRGYPMRDALPTERKDHVHHRSFWFTHGNVNGIDFWGEGDPHGEEIHRGFSKLEGGDHAVIVARNDWIGPDGRKQCEDERTLVFGADSDSRWIDCQFVVKATAGPVRFGDTKEGSFGIRVAGTMRVELEQGGAIVNSEGLTNKEAWGKRAAWVDYYGPVEGETLGIAILNHPTSFRFPTYWHVRTYGLFAANPFGLHNFLNSDQVDGSYTLPANKSFTLRYRVLLHKGDAKEGRVAKAYEQYAKTVPPGP